MPISNPTSRIEATPGGSPASRNSSATRNPTSVVAGAGLSTTVFPATSAVATLESEIEKG